MAENAELKKSTLAPEPFKMMCSKTVKHVARNERERIRKGAEDLAM